MVEITPLRQKDASKCDQVSHMFYEHFYSNRNISEQREDGSRNHLRHNSEALNHLMGKFATDQAFVAFNAAVFRCIQSENIMLF